MTQLFRVAAITDEFSPDIEKSIASMAQIGMTGAELRMVFGKNIIDLTDEELDQRLNDPNAKWYTPDEVMARLRELG